MKPEEATKLEVGDLVLYQEKTQDPELGLIVGKTEETVNIDWFQEKNPYVGRYGYSGSTTHYFWSAVEKVS